MSSEIEDTGMEMNGYYGAIFDLYVIQFAWLWVNGLAGSHIFLRVIEPSTSITLYILCNEKARYRAVYNDCL
jgi:hypothetical protein